MSVVKDTRLWAVLAALSSFGLLLEPESIGDGPWKIVKLPVVLLWIVTWTGFVLTFITKRGVPKAEVSLDSEVDLSAAAKPSDTVVASARFATKFAVTAMVLGCSVLAVWDGLLRTSPQWLRAGIWVSAAVASGFHLVKLLRRRVLFLPSSISWRDHGQTISRGYEAVSDFQVLSCSEIRVVFLDGQKLTITSDMVDLRKVLATITIRRLG